MRNGNDVSIMVRVGSGLDKISSHIFVILQYESEVALKLLYQHHYRY